MNIDLSLSISVVALLSIISGIVYVAIKFNKIREIDTIDTKVDCINDDLVLLKTSVARIEGFLEREKLGFAASKSPISLTKKGRKTSNDWGVVKIIDESWQDIKKKIEIQLQENKNPYDIQASLFCYRR